MASLTVTIINKNKVLLTRPRFYLVFNKADILHPFF